MSKQEGWKITHTDGTTHNGYRWPLPMPGEVVEVTAENPIPDNTGPCPVTLGDGLCVLRKGEGAYEASSGGVSLSNCIGLDLRWSESDVLGCDGPKLRVSKVDVVGVFDVMRIIRQGALPDLSRANLYGADLRRAHLYGANLYGADLTGANLRRADLRRVDLREADLHGADLYRAHLYGADLTGVDLTGADLYGAHLYGADLRRVDLSRADLRRAHLSAAVWDETTTWPDGFTPALGKSRGDQDG